MEIGPKRGGLVLNVDPGKLGEKKIENTYHGRRENHGVFVGTVKKE